MRTEHIQAAFDDLLGRTVSIDVGLVDVLTQFRAHGVLTLFSCQGSGSGDRRGYICSTTKTMNPLLSRIKKAQYEGLYSEQSLELIKKFKLGHRRYEVAWYKNNGEYETFRIKRAKGNSVRFSIEKSWHNGHGFRTTIRFPNDQIENLLILLKETPKN